MANDLSDEMKKRLEKWRKNTLPAPPIKDLRLKKNKIVDQKEEKNKVFYE